MLLSFMITGNLAYGFALSSLAFKMTNIASMMGLYVGKETY